MKCQLPIGQTVTLACVLEVTAHKPGNVHRGADFDDMTYLDMIKSAIAIGPVLAQSASLGVGPAIHQAVKATRTLVNTNTNLGTILLLAPLAAACQGANDLRTNVTQVLAELDQTDASETYAAIRLANPSGLGSVDAQDVHADPPSDLIAAMRLAQDRDSVAQQYVTQFAQIFDAVTPAIVGGVKQGLCLLDAIVAAQIQVLALHPDSLIARKCGEATAQEASDRASQVLSAGEPDSDAYYQALNDYDFWLRSDGHRRNPGTTADLIAAALFVGLATSQINSLDVKESA